jgi:hypothetical protein
VLVSASRRNNLFERSGNLHGVHASRKVRDRETRSPARETHALAGKRAQIGGCVGIFCRERFDIANFDISGFYSRPFGARPEKPAARADHARSVKRIAPDEKLHALTFAQVRAHHNALGAIVAQHQHLDRIA